jgi:hypothetical protein
MTTGRRATPRSLADDLRGRDDAALVALLRARPDLVHPAPPDTLQLAVRASTRVSVHRALSGLDRPTLQLAQAAAVLPEPSTPAALARACGATTREAAARVARLRGLGLLWGTDRALHAVRAVAEVLGPHPAGLGPRLADLGLLRSPSRLAGLVQAHGTDPSGDPGTDLAALADVLGSPDRVAALLAEAPAGVGDLLARLDSGTPVGRVADAGRALDPQDRSPVGVALRLGLVVPVDDDRVVLPREVALSLRGGRVHPALEDPPVPSTTAVDPRRADLVAAGAAAEVVRLVAELVRLWGARPPAALRTGGLPVRDLRRLAADLEVDEPTAARVVELAGAAGLVAEDAAGDEPLLAPTRAADEWDELGTGSRWVHLVRSWSTAPGSASTVGSRDERGQVRAALSPSVARPGEAALRRGALAVLATLPPGEATDAGSVRARLLWEAPRGPAAAHGAALDDVLAEAAWLGLTGLGALSGAARLLVAGPDGDGVTDATTDEVRDAAAAADALDAALPPPVDHVLLQADLTAVAPGPLAPAAAHELGLVADVESRGGATVYRFSAASVRRGLDAGLDAGTLLERLAALSRTPVPQPLDYLVRDTARRHGRLRVGAAGAYLRSDDEAVLGELLADPGARSLQLRRLAPTVLVSPLDPSTVLDGLRRMGLAPAAEGPDGALVVPGRTPPRRATPQAHRTPVVVPEVDRARAETVVRALRAAEQAGRVAPAPEDGRPSVPVLDPAASLHLLRAAAAARRQVWVATSDPAGAVTRRLVEPLSVDAGRITVLDVGSGGLRTLSVHRLTGVLDGGPGTGGGAGGGAA